MELLKDAFIYLMAAVVAVPIAKRLGLGSVLGYLIAGIVIGPLLGIIGAETKEIKHFAEFGVVMMLFLVGLELQPSMLWRMRSNLIGLGGMQVLITGLLISGLCMILSLNWQMALAIGMTLSLSSTAI
ncbi:MAG: cation:proton antiporter, partial [Alphaproteobacteria bacterium]|nr:cation:proton antiporter [Alphaproteobacteria bacterium]